MTKLKRKTQSWTCTVPALTAFAAPPSLTPQSCVIPGKPTESKQSCSQEEQIKTGIKIFGGRTLPHTMQTQTRAGDRCCPFLQSIRRKKMSVFLTFFGRKVSPVCNPHLDALSSTPPKICGFRQTLTWAGSISHTELGTMVSLLAEL